MQKMPQWADVVLIPLISLILGEVFPKTIGTLRMPILVFGKRIIMFSIFIFNLP